MGVHGDAVRVGFDPDVFKPEILHAGPSAGGYEEPLGDELAAVREADDVVRPVA